MEIPKITPATNKRSAFGSMIAVALFLVVVVVFLFQISGIGFAMFFCLVLGASSVWFGAFQSYRSRPTA